MAAADQRVEIEVLPERVERWLAEQAGALQLIDVREAYEHEAGRIADARHIPLQALSDEAASVDRERPVVFYCRVGVRSEMAARAFRAAGYEAYTMTGGLLRWADEGRMLEPVDGEVADH